MYLVVVWFVCLLPLDCKHPKGSDSFVKFVLVVPACSYKGSMQSVLHCAWLFSLNIFGGLYMGMHIDIPYSF